MSERLCCFVKYLCALVLAMGAVTATPVRASPGDRPEGKVVLQLRWEHQFQFAGYYVAQWKGYYKNEGIEVDIRSAFRDGTLIDGAEEVSQGRADFGIGAANLLIENDSGARLNLVASIFQRSAVELCSLASTRSTSAFDLSRLNIARRLNHIMDIELQALFLSEGIPPQTGRYIDIARDFTLDDLTNGSFDMVPEYLGRIAYEAAGKGIRLRVTRPVDYGVDFYGDTLFTSEALARKDPDLVERFRKASIRGWNYALDHPEEVADQIAEMVHQQDPSSDLKELIAFNRFQAKKVLELTHYPIVQIGNINPARWGKMAETMKELGIIKRQPDISALVFDYNQVRVSRLQEAEWFVKVISVAVLVALTLFFLAYLKRRNTLLSNEIQVRQMAERQLALSNSRYETIFRSSVLGINIVEHDGRLCHVNEAWCRMTNYTAEELCTMNIEDLIAPEYRHTDEEQLQALKEGRISSYSMEKKYLRRPLSPEDRDFFYGKMVLTKIWDPSTDATLTMSMVTDITRDVLEAEAIGRSEERFRKIIGQVAAEIGESSDSNQSSPLPMKLEEINLELERLFNHELEENRRKEALIRYQARMATMGEMIGNIAHQWRQPLNALRLILINLQDAGQDPDYCGPAFLRAHALIEKMSDTIDDFRNFSKPRSEVKLFQISDALKVVLGLLDENLRISGVVVKSNLDRIAPIYGLENQFSHVLFNLLSNALDALKTMPPEAVRTITVVGYEVGGDVLVTVSDSGPGIPRQYADKIFDIYFTTREDEGGTGLGLYMTRAIVEDLFRGTVQLTDRKPGTTFEIRIPIAESQENHRD